MTLVNRVSAFFLLALALGLAGYSAASYVLIRGHLFGRFDRQLQSALNVLVAAVEVEVDDVKWQPSDHTITLGDERDNDEVRWVIVDERCRMVDQSRNLNSNSATDRMLFTLAQSERAPVTEESVSGEFRLLQKRLAAPRPKADGERDPDEFAEIVVTVARAPAELNAELVQLALLVSVLPVALWCAAAVVGRSYCRHALHPLRAMASRARSMTEADFQLRLAVTSRQDELSDLAAAFNGLLDQLQQAFERQRRFTGDAAHQLRTPLTVLRGEIDVALRRPRTEAAYRDVLTTLREQTDELQKIVETLLFLARSEDETIHPEPDVMALAAWIPEYLARWSDHPRSADLVHEIDSRTQIVACSQLLRQALDNLISNALKYSQPGTLITIRALRSEESDDEVLLSVQDYGIGIAPEDRPLIFKPFYRSAAARHSGAEGIGLGLALVARIAKALGGTVDCESIPPRGTRFTLQLPAHLGRHTPGQQSPRRCAAEGTF